MLLLLLIVPGLFAGLLAPYSGNQVDLDDSLLLPAWMTAQYEERTVTYRATDQSQIGMKNAIRLVEVGEARFLTEGGDGEVSVGDTLQILSQQTGSREHLLGTDVLGRDVLSRLIYGARWTMTVSLGSLLLAAAIGVPVGFWAATGGGRLDAFIRNLVHIYLLFPSVVLMMLVAAGFGGGTVAATFAIFMWMWPRFAQLTREKTLAARRQNISLLPYIAKGCIALAALNLGLVIMLETALSFAALVAHPPTPAWGTMATEALDVFLNGWWLALFPTVVISVVILSANALGEWVRNRLDPEQRMF